MRAKTEVGPGPRERRVEGARRFGPRPFFTTAGVSHANGSQRVGSRSSGAVTITPYRDGPYLLRGPFILRDQDGAEIPNDRNVVALCRCGKSRTRPFCDGTHRLVDFHAPSGPERALDFLMSEDPE